MSMSKTFAVETYSGGSRRISSIWTRPSLRSFFSWARRTRMSLALLSASIRWSSERTGAWACVFDETMSAASLATPDAVKRERFAGLQGFLLMPDSATLLRRERFRGPSTGRVESAGDRLGCELRRMRAGASGSAKRTVPSATALAPAATSSSASSPERDAAHPHDRQVDRLPRRRRRRRARSASAPARSSRRSPAPSRGRSVAGRARGRGSC